MYRLGDLGLSRIVLPSQIAPQDINLHTRGFADAPMNLSPLAWDAKIQDTPAKGVPFNVCLGMQRYAGLLPLPRVITKHRLL